MFKPRSYVAFLLAPFVGLLPLAAFFLTRVTDLDGGELRHVIFGAIAVYLIGAVAYAIVILRSAAPISQRHSRGEDVSEAISDCLEATIGASAGLWIGVGIVAAILGAVAFMPTLQGAQYFGEAAMLIAAPAMAWAYWGGKGFLLGRSDGKRLQYRGRMYSVGLKIAIVFIGFFVVAVGALVQMIAAQLGRRLQEPNLVPDAVLHEVITYGLWTAVVTTVVFALATYLLARDVTSPMRELVRVAGDMAEGRFDTLPRIFSDDEIGRVAERFAVTHENIRALLGKVTQSGGAMTSGVRLMNDGTETLLRGAGDQANLASTSTSALGRVRTDAESILGAAEKVADATYDSAGRATELRASSVEVARRMDDLFQSVEKTSSGTTQIDSSTHEMSRRTDDLAGFTNDVVAFVAEMDATIEEIHRTARDTADLSEQVRGNADAGRKAVSETVDGIRSAQDSTRRTAGAFESLQKGLGQIDQILLMIEELTNQTNLLSFNAAIIAAQAGSNDFGFSVIADEVRRLAERTRGATKDIGAIIRGVQPVAQEAMRAIGEGVSRVDATVVLAQRAETSLSAIFDSSGRSREMATSISRAIEEQTKATRHLHNVVGKVSDSVAEIQRATAGQAEATRLLAFEAEKVREIALQVKRAADEQRSSSDGIATSMEHIASDVRMIRDRLDRQLRQADEIANASRVTLSIAEKNNSIAEQFSAALATLVQSGSAFEREVARFRV